MLGQVGKRTEDAHVVRAVRAQRKTELFGNHQRHFQDIDGIESEPFPIEGRVWLNFFRLDIEIKGGDDESGDLILQFLVDFRHGDFKTGGGEASR